MNAVQTDETFLNKMRQIGDPKTDKLVSHCFKKDIESDIYRIIQSPIGQIPHSQKLSSELKDFILSTRQPPEWLSERLIRQGQGFFQKYAPDIMHLLGVKALPYCYGAYPGNKVLSLTEKLTEETGNRLHETARFIISLMDFEAFETDTAQIEINKVRLIHSLVRYKIHRHSDWDPDDGEPINQEDMAGTNLAFSLIIIDGLEQIGYNLGELGVKAFLHLWKYIGYQMGLDSSLISDQKSDLGRLKNAIRRRHFEPSDEGKKLIDDLFEHYRTEFSPVISRIIKAETKRFLPADVARALHLDRPNSVDQFLSKTTQKLRLAVNKLSRRNGFQRVLERHRSNSK